MLLILALLILFPLGSLLVEKLAERWCRPVAAPSRAVGLRRHIPHR